MEDSAAFGRSRTMETMSHGTDGIDEIVIVVQWDLSRSVIVVDSKRTSVSWVVNRLWCPQYGMWMVNVHEWFRYRPMMVDDCEWSKRRKMNTILVLS